MKRLVITRLAFWALGALVLWFWQPHWLIPWHGGSVLGLGLDVSWQLATNRPVPPVGLAIGFSFVRMMSVAALLVWLSRGDAGWLGVAMVACFGYNLLRRGLDFWRSVRQATRRSDF